MQQPFKEKDDTYCFLTAFWVACFSSCIESWNKFMACRITKCWSQLQMIHCLNAVAKRRINISFHSPNDLCILTNLSEEVHSQSSHSIQMTFAASVLIWQLLGVHLHSPTDRWVNINCRNTCPGRNSLVFPWKFLSCITKYKLTSSDFIHFTWCKLVYLN